MAIVIKPVLLDEVIAIHQQIPEFDKPIALDKLQQRTHNTPYLAIAAFDDQRAIAYKLGYQLSDRTFYSWLGGVNPDYRRRGIAEQLRVWQESWAKQQGYQYLQVKSMNRFPNMLQLLISAGYQIISVESSNHKSEKKILFEKTLTAHH